MFEASLKDTIKKIFKVKKVTFDRPSDMNETECIFIDVENVREYAKDNSAKGMVTGQLVLFAPNEKLPFGFFHKAIQQADPDLTRDLNLIGRVENQNLFRDKVQRSVGFVYFFSSQFDPDDGTITSVEFFQE